MEKNIIQIFGLQKSGTNFLEWTLNNNFKNLNYKNLVNKHLIPNLDRCSFCIVIYREYDIWYNSVRSSYPKVDNSRTNYDNYIKAAYTLQDNNPGKVIIVKHLDVVKKYKEFITNVCKTFNVECNDVIHQPKNRINKGGANAIMINEKFIIPE